ncbi:MAG: hypothetical protein ACR2FG_06250 [Marmoricola sp.]
MSTIHHEQGAVRRAEAPVSESSTSQVARYVAVAARLSLGWVFLWAFLDKTFGLGHDTAGKDSWLNGGSPTKGFLGFATAGPFKGIYHQIAGQGWADVLFMLGLLAIGGALLLGVAMRFAAGAGALLLVLMWTAVLPPANNPFMDDHLVYALVLVLLAAIGAGHTFGLGDRWNALPLVHKQPWLR